MAKKTRESTLPEIKKPISIKETKALKDAGSIRARLIGSHCDTITAGETQELNWKIPDVQWLSVSKQTYFDGVSYYAQNAEIGDKITFQVVDVDGIYYPAGTVLEEFATDYNVYPNCIDQIRLYKGKLIKDLYIVIEYISTGSTDVKFACNMLRHLDEDKNI